jgi:hypothetical protein
MVVNLVIRFFTRRGSISKQKRWRNFERPIDELPLLNAGKMIFSAILEVHRLQDRDYA